MEDFSSADEEDRRVSQRSTLASQTLDRAGIAYDGPQDVTASRIVLLADADGNRIVFTGAFAT